MRRVFYKVALIFLSLILSLFATAQIQEQDIATMPSHLATDEVIQFFRTAAVFDADQEKWRVSVHGWVYEPQKSRFRKAIFSKAIKAKYGLQVEEDGNQFFDRRLNLLIADNERGKEIPIQLAGKKFTLPKSAPNGHFQQELLIDAKDVEKHRRGNSLVYSSQSKDGRSFVGEVQLVDEEGLSVISDIDDTIKISEVLDHQRLIDNTFLKAFSVVEGMNPAYQRLHQSGLTFHFVSSSPWQLYAPLQEFSDAAGFPWATFSLKAIRFRDMTLFDLFKPGTESKPIQIEAIINRFPSRRFLLIGDSGEQDPEVYSAIATKYPEQIQHVFIRNITEETIENHRMAPLVSSQDLWTLFTDPADISI